MSAPGLIDCASVIQRVRFSAVFSIVTEARVRREPKSVRSGPTVPFACVPRMVWHPAQGSRWKATAPRSARSESGGDGGCSRCVSQRPKSAGDCTITRKPMWACSSPQYSAQKPR